MKHQLLYILVGMLTTLGLVSCSEDSKTVDEYPNWQSTNETYFNNLYKQSVADTATNHLVKVIRSWSYPSSRNNPEDFIVVKVLNEGTGTVSPLYTDSVKVHYQGRLLPSTTYPEGRIFDQSWTSETFSPTTNTPATFAVNGGLVDGFATALQSMHAGDRWLVYIPYQLGYGTSSSNNIPAYSTLVFDITLVGSYKKGQSAQDMR